jgi:hypothetical protein
VKDPHATQKISRQQLDEALKRTKSGTRRALGSEPSLPEPDDLFGPRDDTAPLVAHIDPSRSSPILVAPRPARKPHAPVALATPRTEAPVVTFALVTSEPATARQERRARDTMLHVSSRTAFVLGLAVAVVVMLAAAVGFLAGRSPTH